MNNPETAADKHQLPQLPVRLAKRSDCSEGACRAADDGQQAIIGEKRYYPGRPEKKIHEHPGCRKESRGKADRSNKAETCRCPVAEYHEVAGDQDTGNYQAAYDMFSILELEGKYISAESQPYKELRQDK